MQEGVGVFVRWNLMLLDYRQRLRLTFLQALLNYSETCHPSRNLKIETCVLIWQPLFPFTYLELKRCASLI